MGWKTISGKRYLYLSVRVAGKQKTVYVGRGPAAEEQYRQIERRQQERAEQRAALTNTIATVQEAHRFAKLIQAEIALLIKASLVAAGYYQHDRGVWRVRRFAYDKR